MNETKTMRISEGRLNHLEERSIELTKAQDALEAILAIERDSPAALRAVLLIAQEALQERNHAT